MLRVGGQHGGGSRGGRTEGQGRFDPVIFNRGVYVTQITAPTPEVARKTGKAPA